MLTREKFAITGGTVCTPKALETKSTIIVEEGRIKSIGPSAGRGIPCVDASGRFVLPGFIDIHSHGASLFDLTAGVFNPETLSFDERDESFVGGLSTYLRKLACDGVTSVYPGTLAAPKSKLRRSFSHLARYIKSEANGKEGPLVKGGDLEGTFINRKMAGAQNPEHVLDPNREDFDDINASGCIKLVNVPPDSGSRALELIEYLVAKGITVGAGHTDASAEEFIEAVRHGLKYVIHFTNGPTGGSYKPFGGGGVIEAVLQSDDVYAELILDTFHVNVAYVRDVIARKGVDRIIAVTDQMFAAGARGVKTFALAGRKGELSEDGRYVRVVGTRDALFSSVLTMELAFSNLLSILTREMPGVWNRLHKALPFEEAVVASAKICSTNVARMLGIADDPEEATGTLEVGKWADVVIGNVSGKEGNYQFRVERVFVRGCETPLTLPRPIRLK